VTSTPINARTRMAVEDRRRQIAEKGAELVARYGSYGVSMQTVADAVGLTLPGLNHHVKSRDELLSLIIETFYDDFTDQESMTDQLRGLAEAGPDGRLSLPDCLRHIVEANAGRPELVGLFIRLAVEAHDPAHPAHPYYRDRHQRLLSVMRALPWRLPARFEGPAAFEDLLRTAFCAMDGTEVQGLTDPAESMADLWARAERTLFGGPEWDGLR
jgi:AcrR family transcriptional regulator